MRRGSSGHSVAGMSERTLRVLMGARVALSCELVFLRMEQRSRLDAIAEDLPEQLAAIARAEVALETPGGRAARELAPARERELREATAAVATRIRAGIDEVRWPTPEDGFDVVVTLDVAAAVYGHLATCLRPLESLVMLRASRVRDERAVRRTLSPRPFFDPNAFAALAGLLNLVAAAEIAVQDAQRAHEASLRDRADGDHEH